ncbi:MAG: TonB-dependent receptor [Steroidobacteraceae bacterium]
MSVSAAVFFALYGVPHAACAEEPATPMPSTLAEVVVTATRREQTLEAVPFNLSVVSAADIARAGITDIASLSTEVPGLSMYNLGARYSAAQTPIIRGINSNVAPLDNSSFRTLNQSPVGMYISNSPIEGYFQLDDVQRIEVLRGPQGTLYGAGALGGALRIIPNEPELGVLTAHLQASAGNSAHSSGTPYTGSAMLNLPIGDSLAFRVSGKYAHDPGFIHVYGIEKRTGSPLYGSPVLADPSDPVNSPAIYSGKSDWGQQNTFTGRASLLWKPIDKFNAEVALIYAHAKGDGGPVSNPQFAGGPYFVDPRINFPAGSEYQAFTAVDQPFSRRTALSTLDMSYDAGFATLASTSSYYTEKGDLLGDRTYPIAGFTFFAPYYAGNPINPRFVMTSEFGDSSHTFTQELRLVSNTNPDHKLDYVLGLFYESQGTRGRWDIAAPGSYERSVAQGCTAPFSSGGTFPNCLLVVGPNDTTFTQVDTQSFEDKSVFGELTWHFVHHGQITVGGRHFEQSFTDNQSYLYYPFATILPGAPHSTPASKNTWKVNPSYEYSDGQYAYAIWSQGFRRGGANALPLTGFFAESPLLLNYTPDTTNNYEVGIKGRFANGLRYALALYEIRWDKPQIAGSLPDGGLAVWNGKKAQSKGIELDASGPLFLNGLSFSVGGYYAKAELTEDYSLPANNGLGDVVPGAISGSAGDRLPGSPKASAAATLTYARNLGPAYELSTSLNYAYQGSIPLSFVRHGLNPNPPEAYSVANLSVALNHAPWQLVAYCTNITDRLIHLAPVVYNDGTVDGNLSRGNYINQPRQVGVRFGYSFKYDRH